MKVCGKSPSNTAKAFAVDANGVALYKHVWEVEKVTIVNQAISDTSGHLYPEGTTNLDVSDFAMISLRIRNRADVPVNVRIVFNGNFIQDINGDVDAYAIDIAANKQVIITGDDFPCLNVLPGFQIRYQYKTVPTNSGKLEIDLYKKR